MTKHQNKEVMHHNKQEILSLPEIRI